jgi:hypothetical protein
MQSSVRDAEPAHRSLRISRNHFALDVTAAQYHLALARAYAYVRSTAELRARAQAAAEVAAVRLESAERTHRIARAVLARIQLLGRALDRN